VWSCAGIDVAPPFEDIELLVAAIGRKTQELPLHRIDPGEVGRDEVIAAPLAGHHLKITARSRYTDVSSMAWLGIVRI
jgi:hypothetical protein